MTEEFGGQTMRGARAADATAVEGGHVIGGGGSVPRLVTGIPGFDHVAMGGLPRGRATVVLGPPGSAKTVFAGGFLAEGVRRGQPGVYVSFEETAEDLRANFATLGWDIAQWEEQESWRFVDASPVTVDGVAHGTALETIAAQIGHAVDVTGAERIVLDPLNTLSVTTEDPARTRQTLRRLVADLRRMGLSVIMTMERDEADLGPHIEEFLADNVILMRNRLEEERRRRTIEVVKMRGAMHRKGEYPFTVLPGQGIVVIPLSVISLTQRSTDARISSGNEQLDAMCRGGFYRDSIVLASGATGTGKTLMVTEFMAGGCAAGERSLLLAFEESRDQIFRNAHGWGRDFRRYESEGLLRVHATYPEVASLEDHLVEIKNQIDHFRPHRLAVDSLSALERIGSVRAFREFIIGLTSFVKTEQIAALFTATTPTLLGGGSVTEGHISTLTDSIILLRYVETRGQVKRGIAVLKMRGSAHDRDIRMFEIDSTGMHVGEPFRNVAGILAGRVTEVIDAAAPPVTDLPLG